MYKTILMVGIVVILMGIFFYFYTNQTEENVVNVPEKIIKSSEKCNQNYPLTTDKINTINAVSF